MSGDEMKVMCQQTGQTVSVAELSDAMAQMDENGDGWIAFEEFLGWYRECSEHKIREAWSKTVRGRLARKNAPVPPEFVAKEKRKKQERAEMFRRTEFERYL